ncbi:MAG: ATPase, T2SS/T4P/T4SS family, partial [Patescibacteria group bacterium]
GHIVLSTLHTNSSVGVIPRLIDMGVRPFLIPSVLRIAISQRLIRILCEKCKIKVRPTEKVKSYILSKMKNAPPSFYIYQAKGCEDCNFKGYTGRAGLFEVFSMNSEIADLVLKNPLESLILKEAQKQGMLTMEQEGILKVLKGETSIEEIAGAVEGI